MLVGCIDLTSSMYAGRWSHTVYLVECLRWDTITVIPLRGSSFPEGSIAAANNYCRDPDRMGISNIAMCAVVVDVGLVKF